MEDSRGRRKPISRLWVLVAAALVVVALDQLVKAWIVTNIAPGSPVDVIGGFARLRYTENTGAAFGFFQGWTGALSIVAIAVVVAIVFSASRMGHNLLAMITLGLIVGGALGNLVDRIRLGYVVDFVEVYGPRVTLGDRVYTWPIFNVADSAITIGTVLLLGLLLFGGRGAAPEKSPEAPEDAHSEETAPISPGGSVRSLAPTPAGWAGLAVMLTGLFLMALRAATRRTEG